MSAIQLEALFNDVKGNYAVLTNVDGAIAYLGGKAQVIVLDAGLEALRNVKPGQRVYFDAEGVALVEQPKPAPAPKGHQPSGSAGCDYDKQRAQLLA